MTLDVIAREAAASLRAATASLDAHAALADVLSPRESARRRRQTWVVWGVCTAVVVLAVWLVTPGLAALKADPAPPVQRPHSEVVGAALQVPVTFEVPEGWQVSHDGGYVVLYPADDASGSALFVGTPAAVFDPADQGDIPLPPSILDWLDGLSWLRGFDRRPIQAGDVIGQVMQLKARPGEAYQFHIQLPLVALSDSTGTETIGYSTAHQTSVWAALPVDGTELLVTVISQKRRDPQAEKAFVDVLHSMHFASSPAQP